MDWQWEKFIELQQVGVGHQWNVHDECELQGFGVEQVRNFHLKEVGSVVHEGDNVSFLGHRESVVKGFCPIHHVEVLLELVGDAVLI